MSESGVEWATTEDLAELLEKRVKDIEENEYGTWQTWPDSWLQGKLILEMARRIGIYEGRRGGRKDAEGVARLKEFVDMVEKYAPSVVAKEEVWRAYVALQELMEGDNGCDE